MSGWRLEAEPLPGVQLLRLPRFVDARGGFVKTYAATAFERLAIPLVMREEFYSTSARDVIRGMHYQRPPHDHAKVVYCAQGAVEDVVLDLRPGPGYGTWASVVLDASDPALLVIPTGIAHGFRSLSDQSLMVYKTSSEHAPEADCGIRWDSFGCDWRCKAPIVSERDRGHPPLRDVVSPFEAPGRSSP